MASEALSNNLQTVRILVEKQDGTVAADASLVLTTSDWGRLAPALQAALRGGAVGWKTTVTSSEHKEGIVSNLVPFLHAWVTRKLINDAEEAKAANRIRPMVTDISESTFVSYLSDPHNAALVQRGVPLGAEERDALVKTLIGELLTLPNQTSNPPQANWGKQYLAALRLLIRIEGPVAQHALFRVYREFVRLPVRAENQARKKMLVNALAGKDRDYIVHHLEEFADSAHCNTGMMRDFAQSLLGPVHRKTERLFESTEDYLQTRTFKNPQAKSELLAALKDEREGRAFVNKLIDEQINQPPFGCMSGNSWVLTPRTKRALDQIAMEMARRIKGVPHGPDALLTSFSDHMTTVFERKDDQSLVHEATGYVRTQIELELDDSFFFEHQVGQAFSAMRDIVAKGGIPKDDLLRPIRLLGQTLAGRVSQKPETAPQMWAHIDAYLQAQKTQEDPDLNSMFKLGLAELERTLKAYQLIRPEAS